MTRIAAILFDKDGTLLDYRASWTGINRDAAALAGREDAVLASHLLVVGGADPATGMAEPDTVLAAGSAAEIAQAWVQEGAAFTPEALTRALDDLFTQSAAHAVPVTDLAALFLRLKARGLALGIASSDSEAATRATMERFGCMRHLDFIAGYDSGFGSKPGPGMVLAFCAATDTPPAQVAVVGDNAHDMAMAQAAGAGLRVGVLTGTGTRASLAGLVDICLDSIVGLEALLDLSQNSSSRKLQDTGQC